MSLHEALLELAEPFLSSTALPAEVLSEVRSRLPPSAPQAPPGDPRSRRAHVRQLHEDLVRSATEIQAVLEAAAAQEALRLTPLAMTLDWLVQPPPEASLTRELALVAQVEPEPQRLGEVLGTLGSIRREAQGLDTAEDLVRVRLARVGARVDRWLELHVRREP